MVPQKDPVTMVETIRALKDKRKDFIFFHFGNHQMGSDIFPLIVKHDLEPYYKTPGHIDGVEDLFPEFDVFFISSNETEGLCSSIYDAFVYRVPVVSTLTGGMYDSVADRGLTCGPRKPECLAKHLDYLLDNPEKGKQMAEKAYIWAENNVTIDSITSKYLKLYDELIASKR